jgi:hypothetical protein
MTSANVFLCRLSLVVLAAGSLAAPATAQTIMGPAEISASTDLPDSGYGFTIDQICDGIVDPPVWYNGFAAAPGLVGTIRLDLTTPVALGDFVLWNDINVAQEGISSFSLLFFDAADALVGSAPNLVGPVGSQAPAIYPFGPFENVSRVDLVVHTLNPVPYLEIREVAFNWNEVVSADAQTWSAMKALFE